MQQQDLSTLIAELSASINPSAPAAVNTALQQKIAPLLTADLQQTITGPVVVAAPVGSPVLQGSKALNLNAAFPLSNAVLTESPVVFKSIRANAAIAQAVEKTPAITGGIGAGLSALIHSGLDLITRFPLFTDETISVFLNTNPAAPALIVPIRISRIRVIRPGQPTSYTIEPGSIWILSQLLCPTAPAGMYTGLTISGGTIAFNLPMSLVNKMITMPAGAVCNVSINLQQAVDATVSPDNIGIDAMNAQVKLPAQFSFSLTDSKISIVSVAQSSWNLYGCAASFDYDAAQTPVFNSVLNGIYIGCKVSVSSFTVNRCESAFFTLQGTAPIVDGYWEMPVTTIDITQANTASGIGSLAVLCSPGLQCNWTGLLGGLVNLKLPLLSATTAVISVMDIFAANRYGTQQYNLWANENTGFLSTLDLTYTDQFTVFFMSLQDGEELLSTTVQFVANIDRPVRVDASPVSVKGTHATLFQVYKPAEKVLFLYDATLIAENYPAIPGAVTEVPQEAIALTNALMTVTPVSGFLIYGTLATPKTFIQARIILSFGMYYLIPALPDPYASSRMAILGGIQDRLANVANGQEQKTLSVNGVVSLLLGLVSWPQAGAAPDASQLADTSFGIFPLPNNNTFLASQRNGAITTRTNATSDGPDPQQRWDQLTGQFASPNFSMLDVSTNADLMGVSFSTNNIQVVNDPAAGAYSIQTVDNSAETDILQILGLDLSTPGKFIRAFTVPEISWEPVINLAKEQPPVSGDPVPPPGEFLLFADDGGPSQIFNNSSVAVPIAPIKVSDFIVDTYTKNDPANPVTTASLFTLPYGMRSFAILPSGATAGYEPATLSIDPKIFDVTPTGVPNPTKKTVTGGLQIIAKGGLDTTIAGSSPSFNGFTIQLRNVLDQNGNITNSSILGPAVDFIFNGEFFQGLVKKAGVPVERIDFSGYGASLFSNWQDPNATIAATSQVKFDVVVGRTSLEIVQVRSLLYPWGVRVVRTITMYRSGSALVYRIDSGWRAETDGTCDFSYINEGGTHIDNPYVFHPGVVKGVFNVRNIIENDLPQFPVQLPSSPSPPPILLEPVYFDADVLLDYIDQGATNKKTPAKKMLGYIQLAPFGVPISENTFINLLDSQGGSLGGPVDCIIRVGNTKQKMRINRVEVASSTNADGSRAAFVNTARGAVILPKDGSWSVVQHAQLTDAVSPVNNNASVPLIRPGELQKDGSSEFDNQQIRLANPIDLLRAPAANTINYGLLQNTGTQKVLYQLPAFLLNNPLLLSKGNNFPLAKFADAFHLLNSTGIFPNPGDIPNMDLTNYGISLKEEGYQLLNNLDPGKLLQQGGITSPFYFVKTKDIQIFINYNGGDGQNINYDLNSAAENWVASAKNITLNVALGGLPAPFNPLMFIDGNFESSSGIDTAFNVPKLRFSPGLQPVVDILQVLESISKDDYKAVAEKALEVAMSNSGDNFEYKFHADKEIPVLQFPPALADGPTTPLRLTAGLKLGAYFNEALSISTDPSSLVPSAGAYLEFDAGIQVMCVSLAAATVYAVGQVVLRVGADLKTGPSLYLKLGFGVELMVGLPVVGNVSVTYMAGVEMNLTTTDINVTAFLLFKGEAQLIGGMVDITITIEASGTIDRPVGGPTKMTAQVTFAIDVSIFLVIDINFSKSWSESRQIA
jgi:hypothetical protein